MSCDLVVLNGTCGYYMHTNNVYIHNSFNFSICIMRTGFLVDKFGKYKPVVVMSLLLNAIFHHSLMMIPQQEIPGSVPDAYVMRHPETGNVEVWWSPCPSRECPEEEELDIVVDQCLDHCLLLEQNPKIETMVPPTNAPVRTKTDNGEIDNLNFHLSKRKVLGKNRTQDAYSSTTPGFSSTTLDYSTSTLGYCKLA